MAIGIVALDRVQGERSAIHRFTIDDTGIVHVELLSPLVLLLLLVFISLSPAHCKRCAVEASVAMMGDGMS
jgi:hypothetical protein